MGKIFAAIAGAILCAALADPALALDQVNWTGFYVGGQFGGGWNNDWRGTANPLPSPAGFGALPLAFRQNGGGVLGGGQIGYNWQFAPAWVTGIEADLSAASINARTVTPALSLGGTPFVGQIDCPGIQVCTSFMARRLESLGTIRGRLGYTWDRWLAYVTGGFAYGQVHYSANYEVCCQHPASFTKTNTGFTAGGGLEYALAGVWAHWSIRGEYLFVRLGGASATITQQSPPDPRFHMKYDWSNAGIHIARVALNYKFDGP